MLVTSGLAILLIAFRRHCGCAVGREGLGLAIWSLLFVCFVWTCLKRYICLIKSPSIIINLGARPLVLFVSPVASTLHLLPKLPALLTTV
jgi:hypothetical protein